MCCSGKLSMKCGAGFCILQAHKARASFLLVCEYSTCRRPLKTHFWCTVSQQGAEP